MLHTAIEPRGKSAEAFRTISEVANDLDVPQHVLRFWEGRFSQIRPVKRAGGRRYYRPDDIDLLRGIRALLYGDGLTIKGVQKILRDQGVRYVAEIGRGKASLLGGNTAAKKSAKRVSFEVVQGDRPDNGALPAALLPTPLEAVIAGHVSTSCPETRARLEIRLAELLELKQRLADAQARFSV
jgi:DNA-binding transcriptional MerR regulator